MTPRAGGIVTARGAGEHQSVRPTSDGRSIALGHSRPVQTRWVRYEECTTGGANLDAAPLPNRYRTVIGAASLIVAPTFMSVGDLMHPHESWDAAAQVAIVAESASR